MGRIYEATWGRVFAALYDRALKASEEGGLRAMRAELLAGASGRVLEIGAGTGANLGLYPDAVGELVLVEPSPFMARQMRERLGGELAQAPDPAAAESGPGVDPDPGSTDTAAEPDVGGVGGRPVPPATIAEVPAESLPFPDDSFDTAVATLVLCTVPDPVAVLAEIGRVLKPGGRLLFVEHVRSEDSGVARWQDRFERPWLFLADGCHCNRDTAATLAATDGFEIESIERGRLPKAMPLLRPLIRGSAVAR
jgi:SAM-dependent methyltransferase